jgi:proteasome lid subunit RPN8/RPN11
LEKSLRVREKEEFPECFVYKGTLLLLPRVAKKTDDVARTWKDKETGFVFTGEEKIVDNALVHVVDDFYELPTYDINRTNKLVISLGDIDEIARKKNIIAIEHIHPHSEPWPSLADIATMISIDILLQKPILHIIANTEGKRLILSFQKCHECENSFFKFLLFKKTEVKRKNGQHTFPEGWEGL